jgi:hypothetical protein
MLVAFEGCGFEVVHRSAESATLGIARRARRLASLRLLARGDLGSSSSPDWIRGSRHARRTLPRVRLPDSSSIANLSDTTGRLALASVALCHSEPQARNLRRTQRRDPSRPLGMTEAVPAREKRTCEVAVSRACVSLNNLRDTTDLRALASVALCHSEPQATNVRRTQRRDPSRCSG